MNEKKITKTIVCPKCGKIIKGRGYPGAIAFARCQRCHTKVFFKFTEGKQQKQIEKIKRLLLLQVPSISVVIVILVSHFMFYNDDLLTLVSFIVLILIFAFFQFDARILIGYALLMLGLTAIALGFINNENFANQLAIYAYWLLVVGVTCLLIEYLREQRKLKTRKYSY